MKTFNFESYSSAMGDNDNDLHVFDSIWDVMREAEQSVSVEVDDQSYSDEFGTASIKYDELEYDSVSFKILVPGAGEGALKKIIAGIVDAYDSGNDPEWRPKIELHEGICYLGWDFKPTLA